MQINIDWQLILNYLGVLSWPFVISVCVIYFRKNLAGLIDRITIIKGPGGTEIRAEEKTQANEQKQAEKTIDTEKIERLAKKQIKEIKSQFEKTLDEEKRSKDATINYLLDQLSIKTLELNFEKVYRVIFGSQISLLRSLLSQDPKGKTIEEVLIFFAMVQRAWQPTFQSWTTDQYLNFLITNGLVEFTFQSTYKITDKGKYFLGYISNLGYPENKGL